MPNSTVASLAEKQRAMILARDVETVRILAQRWLVLENALEAEILRVIAEMEKKGVVTEAMLLRNERFQSLLRQARDEYGKYAAAFEEAVSQAQMSNLTAGIDDAAALLEASKQEFGIAFNFERLNVNAIESMIAVTADGSPLKTKLMKAYRDSINGLMEALVEGIAKGWGMNKTATEMMSRFGIGFDRALLIARTEQMRSYRLGSLEQYKQSGVVMQYKRLAKKDDKTCLGCLFMDGKVYSTQQEFAEHPNGRCVLVPVLAGHEPQWTNGKDWFSALPEERQRRILGDARFELWKNGTPLESFAMLKPNEVWGGSFIPTPLKEIASG